MKLSILTPVLNASEYMADCLQNVLEQDTTEAEHIIIDGGSSDGTVEIVQRAERQHPDRVRLITAAGSSQSEAMNIGVREARAKVLGILNADDFYEPKIFKRALNYLEQLKPPAFVSGHCQIINAEGQVTSVNKAPRLKPSDLLAGRPYPWNPSAYFYDRALHDKAGLYDPKDHLTMDIDFLLRALPFANVLTVDEVWGNFRYIPGAKTHDQGKAVLDKVSELRRSYFKQANTSTKLLALYKMKKDWVAQRLRQRLLKPANQDA